MAKKIVIVDLDLNGNKLQNVVADVLTTDPQSAVAGQFYYNSTSKTLKYHNGTSWVSLSANVAYSASSMVADNNTDTYAIYDSTAGTQFKFRAIKQGSNIKIDKGAGVLTISVTGLQISNISGLQSALDAKVDDSQLDADVTLAGNSDTKLATQKATKTYVDSQIAKVQATVAGALTYVGTWNGSKTIQANLAGDPEGEPSIPAVKQVKKGMFWKVAVAGSTSTITTPSSGTALKIGDMIIANSDVSAGTAAAKNFDGIDNTESDDLVKLNARQTLTQKTLDGGNNTFQNIPQSAVTGLTTSLGGKVDTSKINKSTLAESSTNTIPSEKTVADYAKSKASAAQSAAIADAAAKYVPKEEGKGLVPTGDITKLAGLKNQSQIDSAISDAKKAGTDAQGQVTALQNGQVATNKNDIATLKTSKVKTYSQDVTTGSNVTIQASTHRCGTKPEVQVYMKSGTDFVQVLTDVTVKSTGDVVVAWNITASTDKAIRIVIQGI